MELPQRVPFLFVLWIFVVVTVVTGQDDADYSDPTRPRIHRENWCMMYSSGPQNPNRTVRGYTSHKNNCDAK